MKPDLSDKIILITGAGRGLGRHAAQHLAACGATIGAVDIDSRTCQETVEYIINREGTAHAYSGDMSSREVFMDTAGKFAAEFGRIDAVINNAMLLRYEPIEQVRDDTMDRMLAIGIKGAVWGAQALIEHYDPERGGTIINMASPVVKRGYPTTAIYSAVKAALVSLTQVLAAELGPRAIRVNAVSPASVPTPGAIGMVSQEEYAKRAATIPLRRIGCEEDNSNAIAFLLSEEAAFINGEVLNVDGGASIA